MCSFPASEAPTCVWGWLHLLDQISDDVRNESIKYSFSPSWIIWLEPLEGQAEGYPRGEMIWISSGLQQSGCLPIFCFYFSHRFSKLPDVLPANSYLPKLPRIGFCCWQPRSSDLQVVLCLFLTMCLSSSVAYLSDVCIFCLLAPDSGASGGPNSAKLRTAGL